MLEGSLGHEDAQMELRTAWVRVDAAVATPLAVVLDELMQNAVEHGLGDGHGRSPSSCGAATTSRSCSRSTTTRATGPGAGDACPVPRAGSGCGWSGRWSRRS